MNKIAAFGAHSATRPLEPMVIERRSPEQKDVVIEILYCGVCHSDLHSTRNDWGGTSYPVVPGHEIVGRVTSVGNAVSKYAIGDTVAVGCLVDSCRHCESCADDLEQYCEAGLVGTYGSPDPKHNNEITKGGYSTQIVVDQHFVLRVPSNLDLKAAAPLLCAGITSWSPLSYWGVGKGDTVGVIGLGGIGHMGVKFAHAMGANVVMISTSPAKAQDAKRLGADEVLISSDGDAMQQWQSKFDFLLDTIPVDHDINPYISLLKRDGTMAMVGAFGQLPEPLITGPLVMQRRRITGSIIGGLKETQQMLDFCSEHNIVSDVEVINMQQINDAYERMLQNDIKYRFVIDMASLKES